MKLRLLFIAAFWAILLTTACNQEEISFNEPSQELAFSRDTVFCDTVYNQVRSETYAFKVYNRENKDVIIPRISLKGGAVSPYRINVDGKAGTDFQNISLRKKDSLYVFVEIAPVANAKEAIAEDYVIFQGASINQQVTLFSVIQDAEFFIQSDTNPNIISQNTVWTNNKAKIIFGDLTVAEGKELVVEKGTKVYFTKNSGMKISRNGKLTLNGGLNEEVLMRGDRNDAKYDTIPLNWNGIRFDEGSKLTMNYVRVFGGTTGIFLNKSNATIHNSFIHTFQNYGIEAVQSNIIADNLVMNNCGNANVGLFAGSTADFTHVTLANYWVLNSSLPGLSLYAANEWKNPTGTPLVGSIKINLKNSILYGSNSNSILFVPSAGQNFTYTVTNSLLKHSEQSGFAFDGNPNVINSLKNEDPKFLFPYISKMNLRLSENSPAKKKGNSSIANAVPIDIVGAPRTTNPSLGAYQ